MPKPSQSFTWSFTGSVVFGLTQSMESQVGHTLLRWVGSESAMWKEPFRERTMAWWSNRIQLKAPYTPSLVDVV